MSAAAPLPARRPAPPPRPSAGAAPLGDPGQRYEERALLSCLLVAPQEALAALRGSGLQRGDVSPELGAIIAVVRDLARAGEPVTVEVIAATLRVRGVPPPKDVPGWYSFMSDCGLPDFDPGRWCRRLRTRALQRQLLPAAQAVAERRPGALAHVAELVEELRRLEGAP